MGHALTFRRAVLWGVVVAILTTAPLTGLLYLAEQAGDVPYAAFDLFDWLARTLPGDVITRGVDVMVDLITKLDLGETSSTAKTIETLSAVALFFGVVVALGTVLFMVLARVLPAIKHSARYVIGVAAGVLIAIPFILNSIDLNSTQTPDSIIALVLVTGFALWGAAIQWLLERMVALGADAKAVPDAGVPVSARQLTRREFLVRVGSASATLTVIGAGLGRYLEYRDEREYQDLIRRRREAVLPQDLPNERAEVQPAPGTRPEYTPLEDHYRIDINVRAADLDVNTWRLNISGLVDRSVSLSIDDIMDGYEPQDQYVTLACISNRVGGDLTSTTRWTGVSMRDVLADAGVQDDATYIKITGADGFYETIALDLINSDPRVMLAYNWDGIPLLHKHGFPLRIYIPDLYGMKQPKWITDIEVMDHDEDGYWVTRGWSKEARMNATSVVDVAASDFAFEQDGQLYVPVGGIAHAGARGISKVEVRVDDGEWVAAQLRTPLSDTTWVIWRYDWPFDAGRHTFAVRCYEGDGTLQTDEKRGVRPDGATGIHTLTRTV